MKNIFKIKTLVVTSFMTLAMMGCEDFLEQNNPNELSTVLFWQTIEDVEKGTASIYNTLRQEELWLLVEENSRSDVGYPGFGRPAPDNRFVTFYDQTFNNGNNQIATKWEELYKGLFRANQVIDAVERLNEEGKFSGSQLERADRALGEAKFFRGLYHFWAYNTFNNGNVILVDSYLSKTSEIGRPISPKDSVKKLIIEDLTAAMELLPNQSDLELSELGKVTKGAAEAVLGKVYLYDAQYEEAAVHFKSVIDNYGYQLVENPIDNYLEATEFNSESIFEVNYFETRPELTSGQEQNTTNIWNRTMASGGRGGFRSLYPQNWLIWEYMNEDLDGSDPRNQQLEQFGGGFANRKYSLRASAVIAIPDDEAYSYYGSKPAISNEDFKDESYFKIFTNCNTTDDERKIGSFFSKSSINNRVIRLADVFLMYAECLIKGGTDETDLNEAITYVNYVRKRAGVKLISPGLGGGEQVIEQAAGGDSIFDASTLMQHLMWKERPLELSIEGHAIRQRDLARWDNLPQFNILPERFADLVPSTGKNVYTKEAFTYIDWKDGLVKNETKILTLSTDPNANPSTRYASDFVQAAANYREDQHKYFPIPISEITSNPSIK